MKNKSNFVLSFLLMMLSCAGSLRAEDPALPDAAEVARINKSLEEGHKLSGKLANKLPRFSLIGLLEQDGSGIFSINGEQFKVTSDTRIEGELVNGSSVSVQGFIENGSKNARVIRVAGNLKEAKGVKQNSVLDVE